MTTYPVTLHYEKNYQININDPLNSLYYSFHYKNENKDEDMDFLHFHSFYEIHILLDQKETYWIEGVPYEILPNDIVLLRPSLLHQPEPNPENPSRRLVIRFSYPEELMNRRMGIRSLLTPFSAPSPVFRFESKHSQCVVNALNEIYQFSQQPLPEELKELMIHEKFIEFLFLLWKSKDNNTYIRKGDGNNTERKVYDVTNYIHKNFADNLSLVSLADMFHISPFYLSHQFKNITGHTLTRYIQLTRIRNTQYQLISTSDKITTISERCGFSSFSQFNRVFRKHCQQSPSDFRRNHRAVCLSGLNA